MNSERITVVRVPENLSGTRNVRWKIKKRQTTNPGTVVCLLESPANSVVNITSPGYGWVTALIEDGSTVSARCELFKFEACEHHVVMKDLCAECGANLRREGGVSGDRVQDAHAKIPMVHAIPDLHVSESVAAELALQEEQSLLAARKLVLLVDLDQTILHTSNDLQAFKYKNLHRYRLPGSPLIYHTSFRPHLMAVLDSLSKYYEMHICTFGNRVYAHKLASLIDPKRRYFSHRILSRDECFNPITKSANLKALFPRGLNLVCIIDDRGEVWDWSPNLIHVKPYRFFPDTGDINAFPWSATSTVGATATATNGARPKPETTPPQTEPTTDVPNSLDSEAEPTAPASNTDDADTAEVDVVDCDGLTPVNGRNQTDPALDSIEKACDDLAGEPAPLDQTSETTVTDNLRDTADPKPQSCDSPTPSTSLPSQPCKDNQTESSKPETDEPAPEGTTSSDDPNVVPIAPVAPEEALHAADGNYLLRLKEILISLHRSYFRAYDRWRAGHRGPGHSSQHESGLSDTAADSPSLSSTASSQPSTPQYSSHHNQQQQQPPQHTSRSQTPLPHVADIIAQHRARVLGPTCHVTLSGLAPSHIPADRCLAGRIVRSLGAVLHSGLRLPPLPSADKSPGRVGQGGVEAGEREANGSNEPDTNGDEPSVPVSHTIETAIQLPASIFTTHLVACRRGTEKVGAAHDLLKRLPVDSDPPIHLVSPQWLWACHFHWQHMPERDFPLVQDFHPSEFDSEVEPVPGTHRYARRLRRHHHHHHRDHHQHQHRHRVHGDEERQYARGQQRHRHHRHDRDHGLTVEHPAQSGELSDASTVTASSSSSSHHHRSHHRHRKPHHHHHHHHHYHRRGSQDASEPKSNDKEELPVPNSQLDVRLVQSALDSIRAERKQDREEARQSKRRSRQDRHSSTGECAPSKRRRSSPSSTEAVIPVFSIGSADSNPDGLDASTCPNDDNEESSSSSSVSSSSSSSSSPSLASSDSDIEHVQGERHPAGARAAAQSDENHNHSSGLPISVEPIKDADEADFDDDAVAGEQQMQLSEDGTETGTDGVPTEDGEDVDSQLRAFLPPPKSLILADNPLLHLPPQATSQMLAEIEDAVMEEETARATSVPAEVELYDPARLLFGLEDSSSSDSAHSAQCELRTGPVVVSCVSASRRSRSSTRATAHARFGSGAPHRITDPVESDRRTRRWQVQRELLLRRRCRASASEVARIDKMLRRLNACFRREERRRRSADDLTTAGMRSGGRRVAAAVSLVPDSEDSEDGDMWDADYPKGWGPDDRGSCGSRTATAYAVRFGQSSSGRLRAFSMSPAIHSDPEPTVDWWRSAAADAEDPDAKEWNTCPEGYDYADAERTRSLLRGDARQHEARQQVRGDSRRQGHVNLSQCLFGLDDDDDLDVSADDDEDDEDEEENSSNLSDEDSDDLDGDPEDLSGECWDPLREFM